MLRTAQAPIGRVISVRGSQANLGLPISSSQGAEQLRATVGKFVAIRTGRAQLIGVITDISLQPVPSEAAGEKATARLDIVGEIADCDLPSARFERGVAAYPVIGDAAALAGPRELAIIFNQRGASAIRIGKLQQDDATAAYVDAADMLSKHFAVLGTTGVGKSSAVALLLRKMREAHKDLRIFVLDVHNEYGRCFGESAQVLSPKTLKLPFWMFNFEETIDILFGGKPSSDEEVEILAELIPQAKASYAQYRTPGERAQLKRAEPRATTYGVDNPVPYRIADLLSLIDARMGKLENRSSRLVHNRLLTRIKTVCEDPRYGFMFENANVGGDTMAEVFSHVFRLPARGVPMTVMQLAGFPAEVVDAVVSVLCRLAFDFALWSNGASPLLVVCEEAHRYAAADRSVGFGPTRRAISRIAKEGRKYGVFLGLVTQRPAELDPTILSQCSTLFAMRLTNDRDQAILRSAVSDAAADLLSFLPSLGTREALAFGEGVPLPMRLRFEELPLHLIPRNETLRDEAVQPGAEIDETFVASVLDRWRGVTAGPPETAAPDLAPLQLDPERFRLLKKQPAPDA
ncbi:MAG: ATPase [Bradyrhizobiaceae bacterium]|nr:MAG: ATPase [Bradyrhizobiaceae bacterium]